MGFRDALYAQYQNENPEKFNEDLIKYKKSENILYFVDAIGKNLEIIKNIKYLGSKIESIRKIYNYRKGERETEISMEQSVFENIVMDFEISELDEKDNVVQSKQISLKTYFPVLIDDQFFKINGNYYTPIYQLVDSCTYKTRKLLVLKTLIMGIMIGYNLKQFEDIDGNVYESRILFLNEFKKKVNVFNYYFSKFGFKETFNYFNIQNDIFIIDLDKDNFPTDTVNFKINKTLGFSVKKEFMKDDNNRIIAFTLLDNFNSRIKKDKIFEQTYWLNKLGKNFSKNNSKQMEKAQNILISFERILDGITKDMLRIPDKDKEDVYSMVKWMIYNYTNLIKMDNMDLSNKRLRLYEYLLYPLLKRLSGGVYRLLNNKRLTLQTVESIFNIPIGYLISDLVKTETIRYVNSVNTYDVFSIALKATMSGPQSQFNGKSNNTSARRLHPSYLGKIDIMDSSAGDPGVSFSLVPFLKLEKNLHFSKEMNFDGDNEEIDDGIYED